MARSPTGTFTLVAGNPVVTGTIITSDWANTTMPDIGAALTDSLSRTGQGGMLAPIRGVSGSATAPAHSFTDFPRSGMYAVSANEMRYAVNGVDRMRWQAGGLPTQTYNVATGLWEDLEPVGVVGPNLLDNSNFQIHQRGILDNSGLGGIYIDRWGTRNSASSGGQVLISAGTVSTSNLAPKMRMAVQGQTSHQEFNQRVLPSVLPFGKELTFTVTAGDLPQTAVGQLQVVINSATDGVSTTEYPITVAANSSGSVSFTYSPTENLSTDGDYVQFSWIPLGLLNPLPDGSWNVLSIKLEEGNVFTGYEPTPYAIDEAECMKWLYVWKTSNTNTFANPNARGYFTLEFKQQMYFTPTTVDVNQVAGSSFAISALSIQSRAPTTGAGYGLIISSGGLATCEL